MELDLNSDLIYKALEKIEELEFKSLDDEASVHHIFSNNFNKSIERLLRKAKGKQWFCIMPGLRKIAMVVIIILAGITAVTITVPAVRKKFVQMLEKTFPTHFDIEVDKGSSDDLLKKKEFTMYKIPDGMKLIDREKGEMELYKNGNGDFVSFKYGELPEAALWADIRNMTVEKNKIYGLWKKEQMLGGMKQLIWKNGNYIFCITTNLKKENLYVLAEAAERVRTKYIPTYIPKGFKKTYMDDVLESSFIYEKGELYISIDYEDIDAGKPSYDNEHTVIEKGMFQGHPSYYVYQRDKNDQTNGLMWYDDEYFFDVTTNISKEETYKIAKGLKKNN